MSTSISRTPAISRTSAPGSKQKVRDFLLVQAQEFDQAVPHGEVLGSQVRQSAADLAHATRSANAVRVDVHWVCTAHLQRHIELHNECDVGKVEAPCHQIRRDQHLCLPPSELVDDVLSNALVQFAMQVQRHVSHGRQPRSHGGRLRPTVREDHHLSTLAAPQILKVLCKLRHPCSVIWDEPQNLADVFAGPTLIILVRTYPDLGHPLPKDPGAHVDDLLRHRGAEEEGLPLLWHVPARHDLVHHGLETQVQHLVCLVQDHVLHKGEGDLVQVAQVIEATRRRTQDVDLILRNLLLLELDALPAVHHKILDACA
mmetsp:Transcript_30914/g.82053  ORF Transcript_30914/g.82053 Transcript_30914/m.82053 type:complete len:314 (+) Transcript_30914:98-1039(+)